jgi:hypothetical protein
MRNPPRLLPADQQAAQFGGIKKVGLADLQMIFPGYSPLEEITLTVPPLALPGHMTLIELAALVSLVRHSGAKSFAQIGTFDGMAVRALLDNCPDLQSITTVDLPISTHAIGGSGTIYRTDSTSAPMGNAADIGHRFRNHPRAGIVRDLRKDSATLTPEDFPIAPEIFFVDGNHSYQYCVSDTRIAHRVLARPGFLIWHDFGNVGDLPGVSRALTELADERTYCLFWINAAPVTTLVLGIQSAP